MKTFSQIFFALAISACSPSDSDEVRQPTVGAEVASGYNQQMQRARNVELELDQQKRDLDAAIEASDQGRRQP